MNRKFVSAILVVLVALTLLVLSAVRESAKAVVTVEELGVQTTPRPNIRLGAKVAEGDISYTTQPKLELRFFVRGITNESGGKLPVVYHGVRPDTFQVGRDVILEGNFDGKEFHAKTLLTQCPSKYEPPRPGEAEAKPY